MFTLFSIDAFIAKNGGVVNKSDNKLKLKIKSQPEYDPKRHINVTRGGLEVASGVVFG